MEMTSLNVSLPKSLKEYLEAKVREGGYSTSSEYIRALIREDQRRRALEKLEAALLSGVNSGTPNEFDQAYWARKRRELTKRHKGRKAGG